MQDIINLSYFRVIRNNLKPRPHTEWGQVIGGGGGGEGGGGGGEGGTAEGIHSSGEGTALPLIGAKGLYNLG